MQVVKTLREAGFEALFAGGCVRDKLLGVGSSDYDIATSATPADVKKLFRRVLLIGAKFGVAMVILHGTRVEVTTFRSDLSYTDGRRPTGVRWATAEEDAQRRDFTINGMFLDPMTDQIIDYVGGRADLAAKVVRTIGDPLHRFGEDYLRMLRAVRFATRLGFAIDPATAEGVRRCAANITSISGERVYDELSKMLAHPMAGRAVRTLGELDLAGHILPEATADPAVWARAQARVAKVAKRRDLLLTLGALLCELTPHQIIAMTRRWGASNESRDAAVLFSKHLGDWRQGAAMPLADLKRRMFSKHWRRLLLLWGADEILTTGKLVVWPGIVRRARKVPRESINPPPLITGRRLKRLGVTNGPQIGRILRLCFEAQLNEQIHTRQQAADLARELMKQDQARPGPA